MIGVGLAQTCSNNIDSTMTIDFNHYNNETLSHRDSFMYTYIHVYYYIAAHTTPACVCVDMVSPVYLVASCVYEILYVHLHCV